MSGTSFLGFAATLLTALCLALGPAQAQPPTFKVTVQRGKTADGLVHGRLLVNGQDIGPCYENADRQIPAGTYNGVLRYKSAKNFVQSPGGKLGKSGDFLLEVSGVPKRTDILFHAGNKAEHSEGCILCGPATRDPKTGEAFAPPSLRALRLRFYGTDTPAGTPSKKIVIEVRNP
jgi:hypothetical protein